jgi:hypothetical protein
MDLIFNGGMAFVKSREEEGDKVIISSMHAIPVVALTVR